MTEGEQSQGIGTQRVCHDCGAVLIAGPDVIHLRVVSSELKVPFYAPSTPMPWPEELDARFHLNCTDVFVCRACYDVRAALDPHDVTVSNDTETMRLCAKCASYPERRRVDAYMERGRLAARANELQRALTTMTKERDALKAEAEALQVQLRDSETALRRAENRERTERQWCYDEMGRRYGVESERDATRKEVDALTAEVKRLTEERNEALAKHAEGATLAEWSRAVAKEKMRVLQERAIRAEGERAALRDQLAWFTNERDTQRVVQNAVVDHNDKLRAERDQLKAEVERLRAEAEGCNGLRAEVEWLTKERDRLLDEITSLWRGPTSTSMKEYAALKAEVSRLTAEIERAQGKVRDLTECNEEQAEVIAALRRKAAGK
uniref:Uncharacterized protein n=1 Tax=viral metagenome TaxID=1070528 RepID=A0A6M3L046_9ZZZZ